MPVPVPFCARVRFRLMLWLVALVGRSLTAGWPAFFAAFLFVAVGEAQSGGIHAAAGEVRASAVESYGKLPLSFEANEGQVDPQVHFLSRGNGYSLFLTDEEAVLSLRRRARRDGAVDVVRMKLVGARQRPEVRGEDRLPGTSNYLLGNDPAKWHSGIASYARVKYADVYPGVDLIYYGSQRQLEYDFVVAPEANAGAIQLRFPSARKLILDRRGDLRVLARGAQMALHKPVAYQELEGRRVPVESAFVQLPGSRVGFRLGSYDHSRTLVIDPTLTYSTYLGGSGQKEPAAPDCCGDYGLAIAVDGSGNAYVAGQTGSTDFPTTSGAFQSKSKAPVGSLGNAFVTKLNAGGTNVVYSTYLGGTGNYWWKDAAQGIAVDSSGNAYVTGYTGSKDFPVTSGSYEQTNGAYGVLGYTAFVTKLNASGTSLVYSTYLGGSGLANCCGPGKGDAGTGIVLDDDGNAYVTGTTYSIDYPATAGAFQSNNNAAKISQSNIFVTKLSRSGSTLDYSTYLGGSGVSQNCCYFFSGADYGTGIAVDSSGSAYVTGYAHSKDFPVTAGAYQLTNHAHNSINGTGAVDTNAFITKFSADGRSLVYSTYLGGSGNPFYGDQAAGIAVDPLGQAYVTGQAGSTDFPTTPGSFQPNDIVATDELSPFVTCLAADGGSLVYSTYLSGTGQPYRNNAGDYASGIAVDPSGNAYIVGTTISSDFPVTSDGFQQTNHQDSYPPADYFPGNAFLSELDPTGSALVYSSYLGGGGSTDGAGGDKGVAVALDSLDNAYITGHTLSNDFPVTAGAFETTSPAYAASHGDSGNAFVAQFGIGSGTILIPTTTSLNSDSNPAPAGTLVTFTAYVESAAGIGTPTGTVTFSVDGASGTAISLDDTGHARYSTSTLPAGKHAVSAYYSGDSVYAASVSTLTETIVSRTTVIALTPSPANVTYGQALTVEATLSGNPAPTGTLSYTVDGGAAQMATLSGGAAALRLGVLGAGSHALEVSYAGDSIYGAATGALSFTVTPAALTAAAANVSRAYGAANPALTYSLSGFVNGDTAAVVGGSATLTTTATASSPAGTYPITFATEGLTAANYSFTYVSGTLTVTGGGTGQCTTIDYGKGFTATGLTLNGGAAIHGSRLRLTDLGFQEARSAFYSTAVPVDSFTTDFSFQLTLPLADGITFTLQSNNPSEVGQSGGGLGYAGIPKSVALKFDLFDNNGEGFDSTGLYVNGAYPSTPAVPLAPAGIHLHSGHVFAVHIVYANGVATGTITDTVTGATATRRATGDLSGVLGSTAYAGFTGATGDLVAIQEILSWTYSGGAGCGAQ